MKFLRCIIIVALALAYFLPLGGWDVFSHYRGVLLDRDEAQIEPSIPVSPTASSNSASPISIRADSTALGAVTLYSLLLSSIAAEQNPPGSRQLPFPRKSIAR